MPNQKGIIYYRVSTEDQAQSGVSLEQQKNACLEYAQKHNIEILEMFHDDGVSAKTIERAGLKELLKYCAKNSKKIDCVIVYKIDRLSRNVNDYTGILASLYKLKIKFISTTETVDETPSGKLVGTIVASVAQFDNDVRSERIASCMHERIKQGVWCFKAPFGYLNARDGQNRAIIMLDKERMPLVKMAFKKFATGLYQVKEIGQMLEDKGFRTHRNKKLSLQTLHGMLRDKFYIGIMTVKGQEYQGTHEQFIDEDIFWQCQKLFRNMNIGDNVSLGRVNENFPLRHFVVCPHCGRPLTACFSLGHMGVKYPYYKCYNRQCDKLKSIPKDKVESEFRLGLENITPRPIEARAIKKAIIDVWEEKRDELKNDSGLFKNQLEKLRTEKDKLIDMKKKELLDDEDFKAEMDKVKIQIADKQARVVNCKDNNFDVKKNVDKVFNFICDMPNFYEKAEYPIKIKLQGSIFLEKPAFNFYRFQTPKISPILQLKRDLVNTKSLNVD
ncbi:MAG: recombinase family protein, partial [Patescibacteria group bacterium]